MKLITIENKGWGKLTVSDGKLPNSRIQWKAGNDLEIYVKGPMTDCYDLACVIACDEALNAGLRPIDLRLQTHSVKKSFNYQTGGKLL